MKPHRLRIAISAALSLAALALAATPEQRVRLIPKFTPQESLRYQIETRLTISGTTTTPIENPEGASLLKQTVSMLVRLDILDAQPGTATSMGRVRLRATYEKSDATSETDAYDPQAAALEDQFTRLEGHSMQFTLEPDGKLSDITGLEEILSNPSAAQSVRAWMSGLSSGAGFPKSGIVVGQKWKNEQPLTGTPLGGLFSRTEATYVRNEPCRAPASAPATPQASPATAASAKHSAPRSAATDEICAIILTRFEIVHHKSREDDTPEDYRRNGLRTSGTWTGRGESLDSISISTGMVVSSTQTSSQEMDFQILSKTAGNRLFHKGRVQSETDITLLPQTVAAP
ncbi:MAG: hypothetical protein WB780_23445 [Candidatus Acidiferrales bacterium]